MFEGNAIWILKDKFKRDLKVWNKKVFGDMDRTKQQIIKSISGLDRIDEENGLDPSGREERKICLLG